ncbi:hypothetical protein [Lonepinella koalarum]|uniref:hypothetical protein n=1 Tax=Lonepinella koalarum TaxID=53417 RepID=UPI0024469330|nr:hypothetical protein [Lonepinella koalarum]
MITFGYDCPHCGKKDVAFEVGGFVQRKVKSVPFDVYSILATCNYCGHGIVASLGFNEKNPADLIAIDAFRKHADWREKDSLLTCLISIPNGCLNRLSLKFLHIYQTILLSN